MPSTNFPTSKLSPLNKTFSLRTASLGPLGSRPPAPSTTEAHPAGTHSPWVRAAHGARGSQGGRLAAAGPGVPTGACWQPACVRAQQEARRRQHGLRGNPHRAPRQSVTQGGGRRAALPPQPGPRARLQETAQPLRTG